MLRLYTLLILTTAVLGLRRTINRTGITVLLTLNTSNATCPNNKFQCPLTRQCIQQDYLCDDFEDCSNGADEILFNEKIHGGQGIPCRQYGETKRACLIPFEQAHKNETLCWTDTECGKGKFACPGSGECFRIRSWCNGSPDCRYGSDEILYNDSLHRDRGISCRKKGETSRGCFLPHDAPARQELCWKETECSDDEFQCPESGECIKVTHWCDGEENCRDGSDEIAYDEALHHDQGIHCRPVSETKFGCLLPKAQAHKNQSLCWKNTTCRDDQFHCVTSGECRHIRSFCNEVIACRDGSDEIPLNSTTDGISCEGSLGMRCLLPRQLVCDGIPHCARAEDEAFCDVQGPVEEIFSNQLHFRCQDQSKIIPAMQLCDDVIHCKDLSDECLCTGKNQNKILSEICHANLQADVDPSSCLHFQNICNKKIDCERGEDEAFCEIERAVCSEEGQGSNIFLNQCDFNCSYEGNKMAKKCDGIPTCQYWNEEECTHCENKPGYCEIAKSELNYLGVSVCDGLVELPEKTDEIFCAHRFYCEDGGAEHIAMEDVCDLKRDCTNAADELSCRSHIRNKRNRAHVHNTNQSNRALTHFYFPDGNFIDARKVCDGNEDYQNGLDECVNCTKRVFSNDQYMISAKFLLPVLWIISLSALIGNIFVICKASFDLVKHGKMSKNQKCHNVLILNLAFADFLVGIYTLAIIVQNVRLSRNGYCYNDQAWRSGTACSVLGAILVTGTEQSVFVLILMTYFRLMAVCRPFREPSLRRLVAILTVFWILSIFLAVVPLIPFLEDYFMERIWYKNNSFVSFIERSELTNFSQRFIRYRNITEEFIETNGPIGSWKLCQALIPKLNPTYVAARKFGYYSTHGVCLPRLFPDRNDAAWIYSLIIILLNFVSFLIMIVGYHVIYFKTFTSDVRKSSPMITNKRLQAKVVRIVVTDTLCWIPVAVMGFIQLSGTPIPPDVYVPIGTILIPINSALNPFLYSSTPQWLYHKISQTCKRTSNPRTKTRAEDRGMRVIEHSPSDERTIVTKETEVNILQQQ